jgi:nitroreductase
MKTLAPSELLAALNWRYATKKFDPARKIPTETWSALEQALVLSPSSFGIQPWKFLVVTDPVVREKLVPVSWGQTQPKDSSHFVVFAVRKDLPEAHIDRYVARTAELRGSTPEALAPFKKMMLGSLEGARAKGFLDTWQTHQVYIALGQFMASAAVLGVDTCPMEGLEPAKYDEILGLTGAGYATVVACAAGYRAGDDKYATLPKVRFPVAEVIQHV